MTKLNEMHQRIAQLAKDDNELAQAIREQVQALATSSAQQAAFHQGAARACEAVLALLSGQDSEKIGG